VAGLAGSKTHENLKDAFAGESQANTRYLWFAQKADVDGFPEIAAVFRSIADSETGHAFGILEYLAEIGDPISGEPIGDTGDNEKYPNFAKTARDEGFAEIADWFESLARAEQSHALRLTDALRSLS
jgi:rubrerythrin